LIDSLIERHDTIKICTKYYGQLSNLHDTGQKIELNKTKRKPMRTRKPGIVRETCQWSCISWNVIIIFSSRRKTTTCFASSLHNISSLNHSSRASLLINAT